MVGRRHCDIPAPLARGRDRFEVWRRTRQVGTRIPDELWSLAVKLADHHGISRTASMLGLDYYSLKKRVEAGNSGVTSVPSAFVEGSASSDSASARPTFIELSSSLQAPSQGVSGECVVEFADGTGASLRIHLSGCQTPDLVALGRNFWSGE
jgi:hypothetical protein